MCLESRISAFELVDALVGRYLEALYYNMENHEDFLRFFLDAVDGEKDPRNLVVVFRVAYVLIRSFDISSVAVDFLDILFCYFPVTFSSSKVEPHAVTAEILRNALTRCLTASPHFLPILIPAVLEKLQSANATARKESTLLLRALFATQNSEVYLGPNVLTLTAALRFEITHSADAEHEQAALTALALFLARIDFAPEIVEPLLGDCLDQIVSSPDHKNAQKSSKMLDSIAKAILQAPNVDKIGFAGRVLQPITKAILVDTKDNPHWLLLDTHARLLLLFGQNLDLEIDALVRKLCACASPKMLPLLVRRHALEALASLSAFHGFAFVSDAKLTVFSLFLQAVVSHLEVNNDKKQVADISRLIAQTITFEPRFTALLSDSLIPIALSQTSSPLFSENATTVLAAAAGAAAEKPMLDDKEDCPIFSAIAKAIAEPLAPAQIEAAQRILRSAGRVSAQFAKTAIRVVAKMQIAKLEKEYRNLLTAIVALISSAKEQEILLAKLVESGLFSETCQIYLAVLVGLRRGVVKERNVINTLRAAARDQENLELVIAAASLVNKTPDLVLLLPEIEECFKSLTAAPGEGGPPSLLCGWLCRALVMRGHDLGYKTLQKLIANLTLMLIPDSKGYYPDALVDSFVQAIEIVVVENITAPFLAKTTHVIAAPMYQQRVFYTCVPQIAKLVRSKPGPVIDILQVDEKVAVLFANALACVPMRVLASSFIDVYPAVRDVMKTNAVGASLKLNLLRTIAHMTDEAPEVLKNDVETVLKLLLAHSFTRQKVNQSEKPIEVRVAALECIRKMAFININPSEELRSNVIKALWPALEDHKRLVRKAAVDAKAAWQYTKYLVQGRSP